MVVKTKMSARNFILECHKYGWEDGTIYPMNFEEVFETIATKYQSCGLYKEIISSGHNDYRYTYQANVIDNISENDYVILEWQVFGELL